MGIRLIVPYYGFGEEPPVPAEIPHYLQQEIKILNNMSASDEEYVRNVYDYIIHKFHGGRFKTLWFWHRAFDNLFTYKNGYLPCTKQNALLKIMLVKSGRFFEKDIKTQDVFLNFFIHQYLRVHLQGKWIAVDPAAHTMGIPFGKRAFIFA